MKTPTVGLDELRDFEILMDKTVALLKSKLTANKLDIDWRQFEKLVFEALTTVQKRNANERFSGWETQLVGGSRFPDITVQVNKDYKFGVEVKTTKSNHWETLGGSIMEGTRIDGVKHIEVIFAKFLPFEIRHRSFESCVADVAVTHSPRYVIDFQLNPEDSLFKKINVTYEEIYKSNNPYSYFRAYFSEKAKARGGGLWFIDTDEQRDVQDLPKLEILFFNDLPEQRKSDLVARAMALFPIPIFQSQADYRPVARWLANMGILHTSLRDSFSAGSNVAVRGLIVPSKFKRLDEHAARLTKIFHTDQHLKELKATYEIGELKAIKQAWKRRVLSVAQSTDQKRCIELVLRDI